MKSKYSYFITLLTMLLISIFISGYVHAGENSQPEADIQDIIDTYYITSEDC